MKTRSGFTLIEISIVLIIIGLIIGGVFVGRDLIKAAQVRATIQQYESFKAATYTFRVKYNGLAGDITQNQASTFGFQPTSRPATFNAGGAIIHGDYMLETGCYPVGGCFASEELLFWQDLSSAKLIPYSLTSAIDDKTGVLTADQIALYVPPAKIGNGTYWAATNGGGMNSAWGLTITIQPENYFYLGGITDAVGDGSIHTAGTLTVSQAYNIDVKLDDGRPRTGSIRQSFTAGDNLLITPLAWELHNGRGDEGPCVSGASYNLTTPDTATCILALHF